MDLKFFLFFAQLAEQIVDLMLQMHAVRYGEWGTLLIHQRLRFDWVYLRGAQKLGQFRHRLGTELGYAVNLAEDPPLQCLTCGETSALGTRCFPAK